MHVGVFLFISVGGFLSIVGLTTTSSSLSHYQSHLYPKLHYKCHPHELQVKKPLFNIIDLPQYCKEIAVDPLAQTKRWTLYMSDAK